MQTTRRTFLTVAGSTTVVALSHQIPAFLRRAAARQTTDSGDNVLVVVQLSGGNDGLNTVVPYGDDAYHRYRFSLDYGENAVLKIDDYHALHPSLRGFVDLLEDERWAPQLRDFCRHVELVRTGGIRAVARGGLASTA